MICQKEKAICRCGCGGRVIQVDMAVFHCDRCRVGFHIPPHPNGWANMKMEGMIRRAIRPSVLKQASGAMSRIWRKIKKAFRRKKDKADFRDYRRQVLLSIVRTGHWRIDGLKELWETADRIARAEPKE